MTSIQTFLNAKTPAPGPASLFLTGALIACPSLSDDTASYRGVDYDLDEFRISYAYAAIMGTGTYNINGRHLTMLRAPFSLTQREATPEKFGMKWYAPVTIGYDAVTDNKWLDLLFDEDLVTFTVLPGFMAHLLLDDTWGIKPFGHLGATWDFTLDEMIILGDLGIKSMGLWQYSNGGELRWGAGVQVVGEYQLEQSNSNGFSILETGVDYRRYTGFQLFERKVDAGVYYRYQYFLPVWDLSESPIRDSDVRDIHEIGLSLGLKRAHKILGISFSRVSVGYKRGTNFKGWTIGTEFPY